MIVDGFACPSCGGETGVVATIKTPLCIERRRRCIKRCGGQNIFVHTVETDRASSDSRKLRETVVVLTGIIGQYRRALRGLGWAEPAGLDDRMEQARQLVERKE